MKTKKLLSTILALVMVLSLSTTAFAGAPGAGIYESGGNESVPVTLNVAPAIFSVTVPSVLPVSVTADGEIVCAESGEARIINYSHGAVKVTNLEIDAINGWETVDFDNANMHKVAVNSRLFAFTINNEKTTGADAITFDAANFPVLDGANDTDSDELVIDYDALIAPQNAAVVDMDIANIVFTIAWEEIQNHGLYFGEPYLCTYIHPDLIADAGMLLGKEWVFHENGDLTHNMENASPLTGVFTYTDTEILFSDAVLENAPMPDGDGYRRLISQDGKTLYTMAGNIIAMEAVLKASPLKYEKKYQVSYVNDDVLGDAPAEIYDMYIIFHENGDVTSSQIGGEPQTNAGNMIVTATKIVPSDLDTMQHVKILISSDGNTLTFVVDDIHAMKLSVVEDQND